MVFIPEPSVPNQNIYCQPTLLYWIAKSQWIVVNNLVSTLCLVHFIQKGQNTFSTLFLFTDTHLFSIRVKTEWD